MFFQFNVSMNFNEMMRKHKKIIGLLLSIIVLSCTPRVSKEGMVSFEKDYVDVLIRNVNIFNGKDSMLIKNKHVYLKNGLIQSISDSVPITSKEVYSIDGTDKTLMPGLIDAHVHLSGSGSLPWDNYKGNEAYNLSAYLYSGITTIYDLGGISTSLESFKKKIAQGKFPGPDIFHTHIPITVKNSHPIPLTKELLYWPLNKMVNIIYTTINKPEEAKNLVIKYKKLNVDYIKIIVDEIPPGSPQMPFDLIKELVKESHLAGFKVFVHVGSPQNAIDAINAGADVLAHGIWRGKLTHEQAQFIADSKVPMIYTLAAFNNVNDIRKGTFVPSHFDSILVPMEILKPLFFQSTNSFYSHKNIKAFSAFFDDVASKHSFLKYNFDLLTQKGVKISIGTDSSLPGTYAGSNYYREMELLQEYGLSPYQILKGATFGNSKLFLDKPDFGFVDVNYKADLLLINGNPLERLDLVKNPELIISRGRLVKRK